MKLHQTMALLFLSVFSLSVFAEPSCSVGKQKKLYRLELSIPATFCHGSSGKNDPSCDVLPKKSILQLHGLWPNYYSKGYPEGKCSAKECPEQSNKLGKYCKYPEPHELYVSEIWKNNSDYMAGTEKCLERHEWVKHGTCSPMSPVEYFSWALNTTKNIADSLAVEPDVKMSRQQFNERVKERVPELNGAIHLNCNKGFVSSMYVLYQWGDKEPGNVITTKGGANSFGNCPTNFTFASK